MPPTRRLYLPLIQYHFKKNRQMLFLMGPRQVGKTTLCLSFPDDGSLYLNWDNLDHREILLGGPRSIAKALKLEIARENPPQLILDEIHKYSDWKTLLKGFFDTYSHSGEIQIIVTGSARLDVYKAGGDSLMGRYFRYRIHPFTCGELLRSDVASTLTSFPKQIEEEKFLALWSFGGFPEPLFKGEASFYRSWSTLRMQQLFYEDLRDLTRIQDIKQMELLSVFLSKQVGSLLNYTSLANKVRVSSETIRRWISALAMLYFSFSISPWKKNVTRSLLKDPKVYLWDWSMVHDEGPRSENFIASHLLKACHFWTDRGEGTFKLYFVRNKQKREVDFLVAKDDTPWFLVEVKKSKAPLSPDLEYFQKEIGAKHAFQVVIDAPYQDIDCFSYTRPAIVPAKTFLSQLI